MARPKEVVPVEAGQWRKGTLSVWAVLKPHPRQKGYWLTVSSTFSYPVEAVGRRELERMPLAPPDYFGKGKEHPGVRYVRELTSAIKQMEWDEKP